MELLSEATSSLGDGLKKSMATCGQKAGRLTYSLSHSLSIDMEEIVKTIDELANPEKYETGEGVMVHTPIDWEKDTNQRKTGSKK